MQFHTRPYDELSKQTNRRGNGAWQDQTWGSGDFGGGLALRGCRPRMQHASDNFRSFYGFSGFCVFLLFSHFFTCFFAANRDSRHGKCFQFSNEHDSVECMAIKMRLVACGSGSKKWQGIGGWVGLVVCHNNRGNNADNTMTTTAMRKK